MTIDIEQKLTALNRIYAVYDEFVARLELACHKACSRCCTRNVTMTTLEGYRIISSLAGVDKQHLIQLLEREKGLPRFQPTITINTIAEYCANNKAVPEEEAGDEGLCPMLNDTLCSLYNMRPFGCRCFVSNSICENSGFADIDEVVLTVNNVFLQTIEHIDCHGCSGNLIDVLLWLSIRENAGRYRDGKINCEKAALITNRPMTVLMIPPEHLEKVRPILEQLRSISV